MKKLIIMLIAVLVLVGCKGSDKEVPAEGEATVSEAVGEATAAEATVGEPTAAEGPAKAVPAE